VRNRLHDGTANRLACEVERGGRGFNRHDDDLSGLGGHLGRELSAVAPKLQYESFLVSSSLPLTHLFWI